MDRIENTDIKEEKRALRKSVRALEKTLPAELKAAQDRAVTANIEALPEYAAAKTVFLFVGTPREISTGGLINDALAEGKTVAVPLCTGDGIMKLKIIQSLDELRSGSYGIREPEESAKDAAPEDIDFALIPCVSCSRSGERLGQGGGFYDRFLDKYKGPSAMVCREVLMSEYIPVEPHDHRIKVVVSEYGVYREG